MVHPVKTQKKIYISVKCLLKSFPSYNAMHHLVLKKNPHIQALEFECLAISLYNALFLRVLK